VTGVTASREIKNIKGSRWFFGEKYYGVLPKKAFFKLE
jgi:hypothetical protein